MAYATTQGMAHTKTYQNVSFNELITFSEQNPNRSASLKMEEVKSSEDNNLQKIDLPDYVATVAEPAGILGICTCIADPNYYYMAPQNVRIQSLIDLTTSLQQKTDELKTTAISRKRKKIYDLIGAAYNKSAITDKDYLDLVQGISILSNLQIILIKESTQVDSVDNAYDSSLKGEIMFGTNPIHWNKECPIWIIDYRGQWVAMPHTVTQEHIYSIIHDWIINIQQKGWVVHWPEIDETKTEIVNKLIMFPDWQETDRKFTRDQLSVRLGKLNTLRTFKLFAN